jgi:hypothetical protein
MSKKMGGRRFSWGKDPLFFTYLNKRPFIVGAFWTQREVEDERPRLRYLVLGHSRVI